VGIIDRYISLGQEGAVFSEVRNAVFNEKKQPVINGFVAGLGGKDITKHQIRFIFKKLMKEKPSKTEWFLEEEECYRCDL
ncbi:hypothetical protein GF351_01055, partial [Candidatus Woesearchaeota archaeon]|nr:hypothetical protein [Candidatus Woesearchaeota archaeon]